MPGIIKKINGRYLVVDAFTGIPKSRRFKSRREAVLAAGSI